MTVAVRVSALLCAALLVVLASPGRANQRMVVAEGISLVLPSGFHHELTQVEGGATIFELHDGSDTLVVAVYRAEKAGIPGAAQALEIHLEELTRRLIGRPRVTHEAQGQTLLGDRRVTARIHTVSGPERVGWVVAADAWRGRAPRATVVCSALYLVGSPNAAAFAQIVASVTSR